MWSLHKQNFPTQALGEGQEGRERGEKEREYNSKHSSRATPPLGLLSSPISINGAILITTQSMSTCMSCDHACHVIYIAGLRCIHHMTYMKTLSNLLQGRSGMQTQLTSIRVVSEGLYCSGRRGRGREYIVRAFLELPPPSPLVPRG